MVKYNESSLEFLIAQEFEPALYETILKALLFKKAESNKIIAINNTLVISGNYDFLSNFAENFPYNYNIKNLKQGNIYHIHYDRISFGEYLGEDSVGIILTLIIK